MKLMSLTDFINKYNSKKLGQIKKSTDKLGLRVAEGTILSREHVNIYLRNSKFTTKDGIVNFHPTKSTHWVAYMNENYFDSYGSPPTKVSLDFMKYWKMSFF